MGIARTLCAMSSDPAGTYKVLSDAVGSPRLIVDVASGAVMQRLDFDEVGKLTAEFAHRDFSRLRLVVVFAILILGWCDSDCGIMTPVLVDAQRGTLSGTSRAGLICTSTVMAPRSTEWLPRGCKVPLSRASQ